MDSCLPDWSGGPARPVGDSTELMVQLHSPLEWSKSDKAGGKAGEISPRQKSGRNNKIILCGKIFGSYLIKQKF